MEIIEEWRAVEGHEFYQVSNLGRVRSIDRFVRGPKSSTIFRKGTIIKPIVDKLGYCRAAFGKRGSFKFHRIVAYAFLGLKKDQDVDHIDGNRSNNVVSNLRVCSTSQNMANSRVHKNNLSGLKGVCARRNRWQAKIQVNKKQIHLGFFGSKYDAARAYDEAAVKHFGEFARTNQKLVPQLLAST